MLHQDRSRVFRLFLIALTTALWSAGLFTDYWVTDVRLTSTRHLREGAPVYFHLNNSSLDTHGLHELGQGLCESAVPPDWPG